MKYLALIQARCGSSRLPNKVLLDLNGKTVLERVVERAQRIRAVDEVVVATSINPENLPLIELMAKNKIRVFAGSEDDVLDRFYQVAKLLKPKYVIRITADCPVLDYKILDAAVKEMKAETDYIGDLHSTLADGLSVEIMKFSALARAWKDAELQSEREHVTVYIKNNKNKFNIQNFTSPYLGIENKRWTVDYPNDYELIRRIYGHFGERDFVTKDILKFLEKNPEFEEINSGNKRHEGLMKSLANDRKVDCE